MEVVKPFVKWAGGKNSLIPQLTKYYPLELKDGTIERYIEPFVGGGAVLIDILQKYEVKEAYAFDINKDFYFIGKTDEEVSLVCRTEDAPPVAIERDDGWRGFRIQGILDFSLIGILSKLSGILAEHKIGIFAVSTYNTDYILVKEENFERALSVLDSEGYSIVR